MIDLIVVSTLLAVSLAALAFSIRGQVQLVRLLRQAEIILGRIDKPTQTVEQQKPVRRTWGVR